MNVSTEGMFSIDEKFESEEKYTRKLMRVSWITTTSSCRGRPRFQLFMLKDSGAWLRRTAMQRLWERYLLSTEWLEESLKSAFSSHFDQAAHKDWNNPRTQEPYDWRGDRTARRFDAIISGGFAFGVRHLTRIGVPKPKEAVEVSLTTRRRLPSTIYARLAFFQ